MNQAASLRFNDVGRGSDQTVTWQRWGVMIGGGALAVYGLTRRSPLGLALAAGGGALAYAGSRPEFLQREFFGQSSVLVNVSPEEAYRFWHNFENLPRFMRHLESVEVKGDRRSRWTAIGPLGAHISWEAEIVSERENESITWRSLPGSDIEIDGAVEFRPAPANRGTLIEAWVHFQPPVGAVGRTVAKVFGKDPSFLMEQDLRRFKALMEIGEIPTTEGQSHGPRDMMTAAARLLDPDRPLRREPGITQQLRESRRSA
jgi:uncharacterized membrane protein